jgi:N-acetyl-gamma-glutamyl-phosphate reductase
MKKFKIGIVGASGFSGQELIGLLRADKFCEIVFCHSKSFAGTKIGTFIFEDLNFSEMISRAPDCVFFCTPHGVALKNAPKFLQRKIKVIDLSADFRFFNPKIFEKNYQISWKNPGEKAVFGLTEIFEKEISKTNLIANPGCFVTAALLAGFPISEKFDWAVFDAKSGFSGAGISHAKTLHEKLANENFLSYKISNHRHAAEIQQFFENEIFFTPQVLPTFRGICATCHFKIKKEFLNFDFLKFFKKFFAGKKYVKIQKEIPNFSEVKNTNSAILGGFEIDANGRLVIISVLDNLRKGASSQALQNLHAMFSLPQKIPEIAPVKFIEK